MQSRVHRYDSRSSHKSIRKVMSDKKNNTQRMYDGIEYKKITRSEWPFSRWPIFINYHLTDTYHNEGGFVFSEIMLCSFTAPTEYARVLVCKCIISRILGFYFWTCFFFPMMKLTSPMWFHENILKNMQRFSGRTGVIR